QFVRVGAMQKEALGDVLEPGRGAVTLSPAHLLRQMHQLVLEDPLQSVQTRIAFEAAHGSAPVMLAEPVEQHANGDGNLEAHFSGFRAVACGLTAGPRHPVGKPESNASSVQGLVAETGEESLVVGGEEKLQVPRMDRPEG